MEFPVSECEIDELEGEAFAHLSECEMTGMTAYEDFFRATIKITRAIRSWLEEAITE